MILLKMQPAVRAYRKSNAWKSLGEKISFRWDMFPPLMKSGSSGIGYD
jgi:hypothetical protein